MLIMIIIWCAIVTNLNTCKVGSMILNTLHSYLQWNVVLILVCLRSMFANNHNIIIIMLEHQPHCFYTPMPLNCIIRALCCFYWRRTTKYYSLVIFVSRNIFFFVIRISIRVRIKSKSMVFVPKLPFLSHFQLLSVTKAKARGTNVV